jgi:putative transposase
VGLLSLPDVVHRFKTITTKRYVDGVKQNGWPRFPGRLWQRNYYEHIIRDEDDLKRIRKYIEQNPEKWESDRRNPVVGEPFHAHFASQGNRDGRRGSE